MDQPGRDFHAIVAIGFDASKTREGVDSGLIWGDFEYCALAERPAPLIYGYAIDPVSGSLTAMPGSPFAVATAGVNSLSSDPAGRFLYISSATNPASPTVSIVIAAIDSATGALSSTNVAPTVISITSLGFADPVTFDPSGNFAYMILGAPEGLYGYTVDAATGALTAMSNPLAVGANPIWVAISN